MRHNKLDQRATVGLGTILFSFESTYVGARTLYWAGFLSKKLFVQIQLKLQSFSLIDRGFSVVKPDLLDGKEVECVLKFEKG